MSRHVAYPITDMSIDMYRNINNSWVFLTDIPILIDGMLINILWIFLGNILN